MYDSIYMKYKNRHNAVIMMDITSESSNLLGKELTWKEH